MGGAAPPVRGTSPTPTSPRACFCVRTHVQSTTEWLGGSPRYQGSGRNRIPLRRTPAYADPVPPDSSFQLNASDPVALGVAQLVRSMEADGYGEFSSRRDNGEIVLQFGQLEVRGEDTDIALVRLGRAFLDHPELCAPFLDRMSHAAKNPPAFRCFNNPPTRWTTAGKP